MSGRSGLAAAVVVLLAAAPVRAELKYVVRTQMTPTPGFAVQFTNPALAEIGRAFVDEMVPGGRVEYTCWVGDRGVRTEFSRGSFGLPGDTVRLSLPNGDLVGMNPDARTYWRLPVSDTLNALHDFSLRTRAATMRTGEVEVMAGVRAERVRFTWTVPLPIESLIGDLQSGDISPEALRGMPQAVTFSGDVWIARDRFEAYAAMAARGRSLPVLAMLGLDRVLEDGILMRMELRSALFGGRQLETAVTSIGEERVPAAQFEIPRGFREVAPPENVR